MIFDIQEIVIISELLQYVASSGSEYISTRLTFRDKASLKTLLYCLGRD